MARLEQERIKQGPVFTGRRRGARSIVQAQPRVLRRAARLRADVNGLSSTFGIVERPSRSRLVRQSWLDRFLISVKINVGLTPSPDHSSHRSLAGPLGGIDRRGRRTGRVGVHSAPTECFQVDQHRE